ncbi:MAG: alpha/beta fold hydrolase [Cyanobacteria bacterium P01_F01_bin.53]
MTHPVDRNPVVLVHGIWNTAGIFNPLRTHLEQLGWTVYALSMTPNNGDAPIGVLAEQVEAFVHECLEPNQPFDLVGFSMGGLVSRYYVQRLGGLSRVQRFITVSAPHKGLPCTHKSETSLKPLSYKGFRNTLNSQQLPSIENL